MPDKPLPWFLNFRVFPNPFTLLDFPAYSYLMLQASDKMCTQHFCLLKNILLIKNLGTNKDKTSANCIVVSEKHLDIERCLHSVYNICRKNHKIIFSN